MVTAPAAVPDEFWRKIPVWKNVSQEQFFSYRWGVSSISDENLMKIRQMRETRADFDDQVAQTVQGERKLANFLAAVLPDKVPFEEGSDQMQTREDLVADVTDGIKTATMSIRITY